MRRLIVATALAAALILLVPAGPANSSTPKCPGSLSVDVNVNGTAIGATQYAKAMKLQVARKQTGTQRAMVYLKAKNVSSSVVPCYAKWRLRHVTADPQPSGINFAKVTYGPWHRVRMYRIGKSTYRSKEFLYPAGVGQIKWSLRLRMK